MHNNKKDIRIEGYLLKYIAALTAVNVPEVQARAHIQTIYDICNMNFENLATKEGLKTTENTFVLKIDAVNTKIETVEERLNTKIDTVNIKINTVEEKLNAKIDTVEERLNAKIDTVNTKIDIVEGRLTGKMDTIEVQMNYMKWTLGIILAGIASILAGTLGILIKTFF